MAFSAVLSSTAPSPTSSPFSSPSPAPRRLSTLRTFALPPTDLPPAAIAVTSVAAIAAAISLSDPERRRQQQSQELGGLDDKEVVRNYFNNTGFQRWRKIYGDSTDDVNKVQLDIRLGHSKTVESAIQMLRDGGPLAGVTICDAGCGTGSLSIPLARDGAIVSASDISAAMVSEAERKAAEALRDAENARMPRFEVRDLESLSTDRTTSSSSSGEEKQSCGGGFDETSKEAAALGWPMAKNSEMGVGNDKALAEEDGKIEKPRSSVSDIEMMKERFSKLLLGEDMSGSGKGVCTALAISNAITNLCATLFGQLWRLEPPAPEKKSMWQREMELLLCVSDHIVELIPSWQTFPDGSKLEVMTCRPRSDLFINLPALRKLDNMLLEILDSFRDPEFWYVDKGILAPESDGSASFRRSFQRQEEKWWLPVPRVPDGGLHEDTRKQLQHKRECTNQILKAAMAINSNTLAEMEVPKSFLDSLPKKARESLGDVIHRYTTSDQFSPECLLDCLEFSSEHQALEIANRVEASLYVWRRKTAARTRNNADKRELFADRAESLLLCLKRRFPGLTQTTLDMSKIQFNKDVGKSILESYSRVLESLAFNIAARIDDLLYVDDVTKHSNQSPIMPVSSIVQKRVAVPYSVTVSSTPYATACATPSLSPMPLISPVRGDRTPFISRKGHNRGFGVKKVLTDYLTGESRGRSNGNGVVDVSAPIPRIEN